MTGETSHARLVPFALAAIATLLATACAGGGVPAASTAATPSLAAASDAATGPASLNGTYRFTLTQEDAEKAGDPEAEVEGAYPHTDTITLKDGELEGGCFGAAGGTYTVVGDRITFHSIEYDSEATATFSRDADGSLRLTPDASMPPGDAFTCFGKPWTKIE